MSGRSHIWKLKDGEAEGQMADLSPEAGRQKNEVLNKVYELNTVVVNECSEREQCDEIGVCNLARKSNIRVSKKWQGGDARVGLSCLRSYRRGLP